MKTLRLGVIGTGNVGSQHCADLAQLRGVEIAWICNRSPEHSEKVVRRLSPPPRAFTDFRRAFEQDPVDGALVCTPQGSHHEIASYLLEKRIPCFVEKPLTRSAGDSWNLTEKAAASGVLNVSGFKLRHFSTVRTLRRLLPDLLTVSIRMFDNPWSEDFWKQKPEGGGGNVCDQFCHCLDLARFVLAAEPLSVTAVARRLVHGSGNIDHLWAVLEFAGGKVAEIQMGDSVISPHLGKFSLEATGRSGGASLYGRLSRGEFRVGKQRVAQSVEKEEAGIYQMTHLARALRGEVAPLCAFYDGYVADYALEKALEASESSRRVELDLRPPPGGAKR